MRGVTANYDRTITLDAKAVIMKRYWINAAQMSIAVFVGLMLSPVLLSLRHIIYQWMMGN